MGFLTGKRALITGLMSDRSIAYGITEALHREGCELAFTYVNEKMKDRVSKLAEPFNPKAILPCDVASDQEIEAVFTELSKLWDGLDIIIHSVAFAPADQLEGDFIANVSREGFRTAHDISAYSLCALAKAGRSMMQGRNGSITALTYLGSERAVVNYNTMGLAKASLEAAIRYSAQSLGPEGIRVNGISAGPIRTLAASGIKGFRKMLDHVAQVSPLKRNVSIEEVGNVAAFLSSDLASAITGEILHVDCGFSTVGIPSISEE
ncbi:MAG: enoyl-ACP reductase [Gammaproteobacteria bacterium]|jgi:enoyl-[acyl-carrier protein] reductase I|nr:enoyl-ACP reductase [Gammaproteobacteria bacterium]